MLLGTVALDNGDKTRARALYEECLILYRETGDKHGINGALACLATVRTGESDARAAAVLWGAVEALRAQIGMKLAPTAQAEREANLAKAQAATGDAAWSAAWAEGAALSWEQAVELALK